MAVVRSSLAALILSVSALSLASAGVISTPAWAKSETSTAAVPGPKAKVARNGWGFPLYDQVQDPAVRMGTLPNGLKYAIMRNATPKGGATMRLRFLVGWMHESEQERGLAHLIEHLALNETKNLPEGQLLKRLQLHGLRFGADTNAHTTFHETVYKLDIPNASTVVLDDSLFVMREVGGNAIFKQETVDRERGIILSERQLREGFARQNMEANLRFLTPKTRLADGLKANDRVIQIATPAQISALYNRYYRPENAQLVIVGDFDPADMEAKVKARFGDWRGTGKGGPKANVGPVDFARKSDSGVFVHPAVAENFSMVTLAPYALESQSLAEVRKRTLVAFGDMILGRRFGRIAQQPDTPILGAGTASRNGLYEMAFRNVLSVTAKDGRLKEAVAVGEQEYRRALEHGFTEAELKEVLANTETALRVARDTASTRRNTELAEAILATHDERQIFSTPASDYDWFVKQGPTFSAAEVTAVWKAARMAAAPLYFTSSKTALDPATVASWVADSRKVAVSAPVDQKAAAFAYTDFGTPGTVVEDKRISDLGIRTIRFANNVRLNLKKTDFEAESVRWSARVGDGILAVPKSQPGLSMMASSIFTGGGLEAHSADDLRSILAGRTARLAGLGVGNDANMLSGVSTPKDFDLQMQVLAAQLTAPGYRPEAVAQWDAMIPALDAQLNATAQGVLGRKLMGLINNDPRFGVPDLAVLKARSSNEVKAVLADQLKSGPVEIAVVGAIDEEAVIAAVAKTLGALPARALESKADAASRVVKFTTSRTPVTLTHNGTADQGIAVAVWPGPDNSDPKRSSEMSLLTAVGTIMMQDEIREKLGATYSPSFGASLSDTFAGYGTISASAPAAPDKADLVFGAYDAVVKELIEQPASAELLNRARVPLLEQLDKAERENAAWMGIVDQAQTRPGDLDRWRTRKARIEAITPADLQRLAKNYLSGTPLRVKVMSEKAAAGK